MRKRRKSLGSHIIITSAILAMNFLGVSYAYWNDSLGISVSVSTSTGYIDPNFSGCYTIDEVMGNGSLSVYFEDKYTMVINGVVEPGYRTTLNYEVRNDGNIPVTFRDADNATTSGIAFQLDSYAGAGSNSNIQLEALEEGSYAFNVQIPFTQWTYKILDSHMEE